MAMRTYNPIIKKYEWNKTVQSWAVVDTPYTHTDAFLRLEIEEWLKEHAGLPHKDWVSGVRHRVPDPTLYFMFRDSKIATLFGFRWL